MSGRLHCPYNRKVVGKYLLHVKCVKGVLTVNIHDSCTNQVNRIIFELNGSNGLDYSSFSHSERLFEYLQKIQKSFIDGSHKSLIDSDFSPCKKSSAGVSGKHYHCNKTHHQSVNERKRKSSEPPSGKKKKHKLTVPNVEKNPMQYPMPDDPSLPFLNPTEIYLIFNIPNKKIEKSVNFKNITTYLETFANRVGGLDTRGNSKSAPYILLRTRTDTR